MDGLTPFDTPQTVPSITTVDQLPPVASQDFIVPMPDNTALPFAPGSFVAPPAPSTTPAPLPDATPTPRRSWRKSGTPGAYDFAFQTSDKPPATVYCVHTKRLEEVEARQDAAIEDAAHLKEVTESLSSGVTDQTSPQEVAALKSHFRVLTAQVVGKQVAFSRSLVEECVIGWENAPEPYSREALLDLPDSIVLEWANEITNQSHLTQKEADFLSQISSHG